MMQFYTSFWATTVLLYLLKVSQQPKGDRACFTAYFFGAYAIVYLCFRGAVAIWAGVVQ